MSRTTLTVSAWILCLLVASAQETPPPAQSRPSDSPEPAVSPGTDAAQEGPASRATRYAVVTGNEVRARSGPGDNFPEVLRFKKNDLVRVTGKNGDWNEVEVPGGFACYVAAGQDSHPYVEEHEAGAGVVVVNSLQLRPTPSTDHPPMGKLDVNARVTILDREGPWIRIAAPASAHLYMFHQYLDAAGDQLVLAAKWADSASAKRSELLTSAPRSKAAVDRENRAKTLAARAKEADALYEEELAKGRVKMDCARVRKAYADVYAASPPGSAMRTRAEERMSHLDTLASMTGEVRAAEAKVNALKGELAVTESRYSEELEGLRNRKPADPKVAVDPYILRGWVRRSTIPAAVAGVPEYSLEMGGKMLCYIESSRFNLALYSGKMVGVSRGDGPSDRAGLRLKVLTVDKMEILAK